MRVRATGRYRAVLQLRGGLEAVALEEGDEVELDDDIAECVLRDAPGVVVAAADDAPEPAARALTGGADRMVRDTPDRDLVCDDCGFEAASPAGLGAHRRRHRNDDDDGDEES